MDKIFQSLDDNTVSALIKLQQIQSFPEILELSKSLTDFCNTQLLDPTLKERYTTLKEKSESEIVTLKKSLQTATTKLEAPLSPKKPVVIYMDGVFDTIHSGHFNAIRQSKKLGDILLVGINSDEGVAAVKGPTMMSCKERSALAEACKWVDKIVPDTPYSPSIELLDKLHADFCAHGNDICMDQHGNNVYGQIFAQNRMKVFKRTEGVSSTEIMGRLIANCLDLKVEEDREYLQYEKNKRPLLSSFLATSHRICSFSDNKVPKPGDKVVYICGSFDLLHIGLIEMLKKAKGEGDFLYVGVYDDDISHRVMGKNFPIMNVNERVFNLLSLKYVDEVICGCPYKITEDLIMSLNIDVVLFIGAKEDDYLNEKMVADSQKLFSEFGDQYEIPKKLGKFKFIECDSVSNNDIFIERLKSKKDLYVKRYLKKAAASSNIETGLLKNINEI